MPPFTGGFFILNMIAIPDNIFLRLFADSVLKKNCEEIKYVSSSLALNNLLEDRCDAAIIPSLDLLQHKDLFISARNAISFDGYFSNQYLYFKENEKIIQDLYLRGDLSKNEIILSKILFRENYSSDINIIIDTKSIEIGSKNYLVSGNENFSDSLFKKGISFCDEICDLLDAPYVNYVIASKNRDTISEINRLFIDAENKVENYLRTSADVAIGNELKTELLNNFNSFYFEMTEIESDSLKELLRICYYQGLAEELFDINFV